MILIGEKAAWVLWAHDTEQLDLFYMVIGLTHHEKQTSCTWPTWCKILTTIPPKFSWVRISNVSWGPQNMPCLLMCIYLLIRNNDECQSNFQRASHIVWITLKFSCHSRIQCLLEENQTLLKKVIKWEFWSCWKYLKAMELQILDISKWMASYLFLWTKAVIVICFNIKRQIKLLQIHLETKRQSIVTDNAIFKN